MNVRELRSTLFDLPDQEAVITVIDPHLHVECHVYVEAAEWAVGIFSTGSVVTEEDVL